MGVTGRFGIDIVLVLPSALPDYSHPATLPPSATTIAERRREGLRGKGRDHFLPEEDKTQAVNFILIDDLN